MNHVTRTSLLILVMTIAIITLTVPAFGQTCPEMVGRWPYGPASAIEMSGSTAYVAMGSALKIFDLTDPIAPVELGEVSVPGAIEAIDLDGSYAYLAAGEAGLRVIDVSMASAPVEAGYDPLGNWTTDVVVAGAVAYVTDGSELWVLDMTASWPVPIAIFGLPLGTGSALALDGNHVFVAVEHSSGTNDLVVVDVSDPHDPLEVGGFDGGATYPADLIVNSGIAFLVDETGLRFLDVSDPTSPSEISRFNTSFGIPKSVALDGSYAYLGVDRYASGYVDVIDISIPSAPYQYAGFDAPGPVQGISASGHQVQFAATGAGLRIVDWWLGTELGFSESPGSSVDVALEGTTAYLLSSSGLTTLDVSSATTPFEFGSVEGGGEDLEVVGSHLFVAAGSEGLRVLDISNRADPIEVAVYPTPNWAGAVAVSEGLAYIAVTDSLRIVDVGVPSSPVELGSLAMTTVGVAIEGDHAFVTDGSGLRVVDVSDPTSPVESGYLPTPGTAWGIVVNASLAYVSTWTDGLRVIDVSDPSSPVEIGALDSVDGFFRNAAQVSIDGEIVYLADGSTQYFAGLTAIDVSNPIDPVEVGFSKSPGVSRGMSAGNDHVFLADSEAGLTIYSSCTVASPEVFTDGFESGDTSAWSASSL